MKNKEWFMERIGKKVYRSKSSCKCNICNDNHDNGFIIMDELHAINLFDLEKEFIVRYFDSIEERNEYELRIEKIPFGLSPKHIEIIENELDLYDEIIKNDVDDNVDKHFGKFSFYFWKKVGNKVSWCPHTLSLFYFRHLDKQAKEKEAASINVSERLEDALKTCWASLNTYGEHIIIDKKVKNAIKLKNEQHPPKV